MPYVLQNRVSRQLFSCMLINVYQFEYYGVKFWEDAETAEREFASFLVSQGEDRLDEWQPVEIDENTLKIGNVKLKNDPNRLVLLSEDGKVQPVQSDPN